ncbi:hypothetical protein D3C80_979130 [compost metagenome]
MFRIEEVHIIAELAHLDKLVIEVNFDRRVAACDVVGAPFDLADVDVVQFALQTCVIRRERNSGAFVRARLDHGCTALRQVVAKDLNETLGAVAGIHLELFREHAGQLTAEAVQTRSDTLFIAEVRAGAKLAEDHLRDVDAILGMLLNWDTTIISDDDLAGHWVHIDPYVLDVT